MTEAIVAIPQKEYNMHKNTEEPVTYYVDLTDKPDVVEIQNPKKNVTVGGVALAAAGAAGTAKITFEGLKKAIGGAIGWVESQIKEFTTEIGQNFAGIPDKLKSGIKYGGAAAGALLAALLVFKDSDKDGKLDVLESIEKFVNPTK